MPIHWNQGAKSYKNFNKTFDAYFYYFSGSLANLGQLQQNSD